MIRRKNCPICNSTRFKKSSNSAQCKKCGYTVILGYHEQKQTEQSKT
jgi:hypothetical protein